MNNKDFSDEFENEFSEANNFMSLGELNNIITLNDESGNEVPFEFLDLVEYQGNEYVVLYPINDSDEPAEVAILMVEDLGGDEETYVSVGDENTLMAVFKIFKDKFKDMLNFTD